ncbi:putative auxin response factor 21 [Raphanus sativus]|nr:putative auxin response factor 21 [Raphanus sativus]
MVEATTDEIYAEISLLPDTSEVEIPIPKHENNIQNISYFTKVLSASDTNKKGSFVLNKRHAIECLPLLDTSRLTPSQEVISKDIHGHEWNFKHTLRGKPERHLFTSGWNEFAKKKDLVVGDSFVFLRSSQFLVNFDKFIDGVSKKFSIGSKFLMKFEGKYFNEIRYCGTIVGVRDFSLTRKIQNGEVQWDEAATIPRPDNVSPWEIEPLIHSPNILKSVFLKNKRKSEMHEFGSNMWVPTLTRGQEIGQSSIQSSMSYSFPTMSKQNYNDQMVQEMKEPSTTTTTTSCRLRKG